MAGFIALFIIVTALFSFLWRSKNKRHDKFEVERQRDLKEQGWGMQGWDRSGRVKREGNELGGVFEHAEEVDRPKQEQQAKPE